MIICADDYGISPAVSDGIIELIDKKRISSTSCIMTWQNLTNMTNMMKQLKKAKDKVDIGLHIVLTDALPLTQLEYSSGLIDKQGRFLSFWKLLINAWKNCIDYYKVHREIMEQLNRFVSLMGCFPDYIDGHQHVHQLPVIRNAVANIAQHINQRGKTIYIRVARLPFPWLLTKAATSSRVLTFDNFFITLPGKITGRLMDSMNIPHNRFLMGYYDYSNNTFKKVFRWYLTLKPKERDIFFCHPGYVDQKLRDSDSIVNGRMDVLNFLLSSEYLQIMEQEKITLNTFFGISREV